MPRYFIEVAYKGARYSGFQVQQNANSVQAEVTNALSVFYRRPFELTGSSRTDAGVHALQNFFHFDSAEPIKDERYHLNAILPTDIVINSIKEVQPGAHARFDALSRQYGYYLYTHKDPFLEDRAYYYPYALDLNKLNEAATELMQHEDFTSFSKRNSQVHTFNCRLLVSKWEQQGNNIVYTVEGNRFLRGMVRGLVGTMLQVGKGKLSLEAFGSIIRAKDCTKADFAVPAHGLFLRKVNYPDNY